MIIGIDASRANSKERTGTEWYSFFVIEELKKIDTQNEYRLYSKSPLEGDLGKLKQNFKSAVLKWPPAFLWTQLRSNISSALTALAFKHSSPQEQRAWADQLGNRRSYLLNRFRFMDRTPGRLRRG